MKKEKIDPELLREEIQILHRASDALNDESVRIMKLKNLSANKTLDLNSAFRTAKRELILAQTELWNKLMEPILDLREMELRGLVKKEKKNSDPSNYEIIARYNPQKKKRTKK